MVSNKPVQAYLAREATAMSKDKGRKEVKKPKQAKV
jgi:hypothetical protein